MLQAAIGDGLTFDAVSLLKDGLAAPKIDVGGREIVQALVIAIVDVQLAGRALRPRIMRGLQRHSASAKRSRAELSY